MPHKRNPVRSEEAVMLGRLMRGHAGTMFELMEGYDERDFSTALAEFAVIPESFLYASRSLAYVHEVLSGLVVNPERMQENLDIFGGLVASEAVLMALADEIGRQTAHDVLHEAAMDAFESGRPFADVLREDDRVTEALSDEDIDRLTDASAYTGLSAQLARGVVERSRHRG